MSSNRILSDKGLQRGTTYTLNIDGYNYVLKTANHAKPVAVAKEKDADGLPGSSSFAADWETISGEIMAYAGIPAPSQLKPFTFGGIYYALANLSLNQSTEGLRSYTCEVHRLAGTSASDFTETP